MHMYQCRHVQYMFNIKCPANTHMLAFYLMQSNVLMLDYRLQWPACKTDNGPNGMRNHFEQAAVHLLPYDPVAKKQATCIKRGSALISLTEAESEPIATIAANDTRPSIGKTGVHLCYHKHHEYKKLMRKQHRELGEWRQNNPDAHKSSFTKKYHGTDKSTQSKQILTLVSKQVAAEMQKLNQSANVDTTLTAQKSAPNDEQYLMSVVQSAVANHFATPPTAPPNSAPLNLKSIIKQAPNSSS